MSVPSPDPSEASGKKYLISQLDSVEAIRCPCGWSRRSFAAAENTPATVHLVDIEQDARSHYHKTLTEIYVILEGEGHMELDGELVAVRPLTSIVIQPGCRHRAVGIMKILNIPIPAFDPEDEWFD